MHHHHTTSAPGCFVCLYHSDTNGRVRQGQETHRQRYTSMPAPCVLHSSFSVPGDINFRLSVCLDYYYYYCCCVPMSELNICRITGGIVLHCLILPMKFESAWLLYSRHRESMVTVVTSSFDATPAVTACRVMPPPWASPENRWCSGTELKVQVTCFILVPDPPISVGTRGSVIHS